MKIFKLLLLLFTCFLFSTSGFSQADKYWSVTTANRASITPDKAVARLAYPKVYRLFNLDLAQLHQQLFKVIGTGQHSTVITLPNADGGIEQFEVWETSNFVPELQAMFPEIRAFTGKGITVPGSILKLSISPEGIQTMTFRIGNESEFI
ncbi:MAG TPA: hypothetical protein VKH37_00660, partial [Ferruginibacter sp.]|nr:hypothetical protein [Ferruginibacter sp.]